MESELWIRRGEGTGLALGSWLWAAGRGLSSFSSGCRGAEGEVPESGST